MFKRIKPRKTSLKVNTSYVGERIEEKIHRIVNNKEPIKDGAPIIYTPREEGVNPAYDIRTDRWEVANDLMDKVSKSHKAKRDHSLGERAKKNMEKEQKSEKELPKKDGGAESTQATE